MTNTIQFDVSEHVAILTMNRPDSANSINREMAIELANAAVECDNNRDIKAVVLTGSGSFFCGGGDLRAFTSGETEVSEYIQTVVTNLHAAISHFARMDAPLICAVNGPAGGAGVSLAASGDIVVAADCASFVLGYTAVGLVPDGGSTYNLPRRIGWSRAAELMLTNRKVNANEAYRIGLVTEIVNQDNLARRARGLAAALARGPTEVLGATKRLLASSGSESLETQLALEERGIVESARHANAAAGIQAFLNKCEPNFESYSVGVNNEHST